MIERKLYLYIMKQVAEELPSGLEEGSEEDAASFMQRFEDFIKFGYELNNPEECQVEIWSAMGRIRANLTDDEWARLAEVISDQGDIQLIRVTMFGKPMLETGWFNNAPPENAAIFMDLPTSVLKGVVKGIVEVCREQDLELIKSLRGQAPGTATISDSFKRLFDEIIEDEIEEAVSDFRQELMAEVTAAQFVPWGPPTGQPAEGGEPHGRADK